MPTKIIKSWCEPFFREDRANHHITKTDIPKAVEFFQGTLGGTVAKLYLNPMFLEKKTFIDYSFPEDVEVIAHPGCASWEIWGETTGSAPAKNEKAGGDFLDAHETPQNALFLEKQTSASSRTPPNKNKALVFNCSALKTTPRLKLSVKRGEKTPRQGILL